MPIKRTVLLLLKNVMSSLVTFNVVPKIIKKDMIQYTYTRKQIQM